jgi:D-glycero-alpha-D-manno-heptose-7-phosphate kinase
MSDLRAEAARRPRKASQVATASPRIRRIRTKAPLRISFCGGGTDVLPYAAEQGGCVLNATIDRYAYATLVDHGRRDFVVHSLDYNLTKQLHLERPLVYDGQLDLVKAAFKWLNLRQDSDEVGFELHLHTDAPPGSGLGSSSAVVVAMINSFAEWYGISLSTYDKAHLAYVLEREELRIEGGMQDQYSAVFGGFNFVEFSADGVVVNPLRIPPEVVNELQYSLVLCYMGAPRLSAQIIGSQISNYEAGQDEVLTAMQRLKELTVAMKNALVRGRLDEFGSLLHEAWLSKKRMATEISTPQIEEAYEEARRCGALGGKISGAGGGGYMYFFCPDETRHRVGDRLEQMGLELTRFAFEPHGVQTWGMPFGS